MTQRTPDYTGGRFLPGVNFQVNHQAIWPGEEIFTLGAGIRDHSNVCLLVILKDPRLRESLITLGTGIRFLPGVNYHVSPQVF